MMVHRFGQPNPQTRGLAPTYNSARRRRRARATPDDARELARAPACHASGAGRTPRRPRHLIALAALDRSSIAGGAAARRRDAPATAPDGRRTPADRLRVQLMNTGTTRLSAVLQALGCRTTSHTAADSRVALDPYLRSVVRRPARAAARQDHRHANCIHCMFFLVPTRVLRSV